MSLTDGQIANIVFNETRSLSGSGIQEARINIVHSIINALANVRQRPRTGPTVAHVPQQESAVYDDCVAAVTSARANRQANIDPTSGATNFNFRRNNLRGDFFGLAIKTQVGPLDNSYPTTALPATNIYANTYGN